MFNDKYGLTQAVLEGRKTMTRRIIQDDVVERYSDPWDLMGNCARYHFGEVVAIAQSYNDVNSGGYPVDSRYDPFRTAYYSVGCVKESNGGWNNKMFVKADLMPHHIKITNVHVERLQDCSDDDILREGVLQSADGYDCYTFDGWVNRTKGKELPTQIYTKNRREAFATLIDKVSGKGTWEKNPWVFVYEFDLID